MKNFSNKYFIIALIIAIILLLFLYSQKKFCREKMVNYSQCQYC